MTDKQFKFAMGSRVVLAESDGTEEGCVIGQARYDDSSDNFLIRYRAGNGQQVERWWTANAIEGV